MESRDSDRLVAAIMAAAMLLGVLGGGAFGAPPGEPAAPPRQAPHRKTGLAPRTPPPLAPESAVPSREEVMAACELERNILCRGTPATVAALKSCLVLRGKAVRLACRRALQI